MTSVSLLCLLAEAERLQVESKCYMTTTYTKEISSEVSSNKNRAEKLSKRVKESLKNAQQQKQFRESAAFSNGDAIAQESFQIEEYHMTPKLAKEILNNCNLLNRKRDHRKVVQYCQEILNGDWKFEASSVMLDKKGFLIDGQHTLGAIVLAKRKTPVILMTGCREGVAEKIDCGRARTVAQRFKFAGIFDPKNTNAKNLFMMRVIGTILKSEETPSGKKVKSGTNERGLNYYPDESIKRYLKEFKNGFEWINENKSRSKGFSQAAVLAPIVVYYNKNEEKAKKFYNTLLAGEYTGKVTTATNAVRTLRKHIVDVYDAIANDDMHKLPKGFYGQGRSQVDYFLNLTKKCIKCYDENKTFKI